MLLMNGSNYKIISARQKEIATDILTQWQGNEYGTPLLPISHRKVEKVDYIMRIPPILAIFLLHPRNLEPRHDPGPQLLASTIQVLITNIQNKYKQKHFPTRWLASNQVDILSLPPRWKILKQYDNMTNIPGLVNFLESWPTSPSKDSKRCLLRSLLHHSGAAQPMLLQCGHLHKVTKAYMLMIHIMIAFTRISCLYCWPVSNKTSIFWGSLETVSEVWQTFQLVTSQQRMCIFCKAPASQVSFNQNI